MIQSASDKHFFKKNYAFSKIGFFLFLKKSNCLKNISPRLFKEEQVFRMTNQNTLGPPPPLQLLYTVVSEVSLHIMSFVVYYEIPSIAVRLSLTAIVGKNGQLYWLQKDVEALFCEVLQKSTICVSNITDLYDIFPIASNQFLKEQVITHSELCALFEKTKIGCVKKFGKKLNNHRSLMELIKEEDCTQFRKPTLIRLLNKRMRRLERCQIKAFLMDSDSPITFFVWSGWFKVRVQQEFYNLQPKPVFKVEKKPKFIFPKRLTILYGDQMMHYIREVT